MLLLATAICAATVAAAVRAGDVLLFLAAAGGTAFSGLLAYRGLAARREQRGQR